MFRRDRAGRDSEPMIWFYQRGGQHLYYEVRLRQDGPGFELGIWYPEGTVLTEHFDTEDALVLVDPPRSGVDKHALDSIRALAPQVIAYVSCDPSTLARDAARLTAGGYQLTQVRPFDLFPHTYHIESLSIFERV